MFYKTIKSDEHLFEKGYARIFVHKKEDVEKVEKLLKEIDPYEWEHYLPEKTKLVAVWNPDEKNELVYHSKIYKILRRKRN